MADVRLPGTLTPLFPGLPRRVVVEAPTVLAAIDWLETQWPGLRDRIVEEGPAIRRHLHVYVDGERAGLDTPVEARSRLDVIAAISGGSRTEGFK
jgi:sulfur-carrier protein